MVGFTILYIDHILFDVHGKKKGQVINTHPTAYKKIKLLTVLYMVENITVYHYEHT
jgi:hypothetical protein